MKLNKPKRVLATSAGRSDQPAGDISLSSKKNCAYCKLENHYISSCRSFKVLPHKAKCEFIKASRLCFKCLQSSHMARECKNRSSCYHCHGEHPTILHGPTKSPANYQLQSTPRPVLHSTTSQRVLRSTLSQSVLHSRSPRTPPVQQLDF